MTRGTGAARFIEVFSTMALTVTAAFVAAEALRGPATTLSDESERRFIPQWQDALPFATRVKGDGTAPIVLLVLVDLACPSSKALHEAVSEVMIRRPGELQVQYVHYPLDYHLMAAPAALGAECALAHGREAFARWVDVIFEEQSRLNDEHWGRYAAQAALPDTALIASCASEDIESPSGERIRQGLAFGNEVGLDWTPMVIIDGWYYPRPPSAPELLVIVDSLSAARRAR